MKKLSASKKNLKQLIKQFSKALSLNANSAKAKLLLQEIKFILSQLRFSLSRRELRRIVAGVAIVAGLSFTQQANGQASFAPPVTNPFGLTSAYQRAAPVKADLDNDGDFDLLVQEYYGNFQYYQNTGSVLLPAFAAPVQNPFGLTISATNFPKVTLVDLDNDGDLDLMAADYNSTTYAGNVKYFQNTGTATAPAFAAPITNPFGITPGTYINLPELVDLDNDGDYDLISVQYNSTTYASQIQYQQNIGTATAPNFAAPTINPMGLSLPTGLYVGSIAAADLDNDGDFDLIMGDTYSNADFYYYQNNGTPAAAAFAPSQLNPFGLVALNPTNPYGKANIPAFIDLDGDSDLDVVAGDYGGNLIYFQNLFIASGPLAINNIIISSPSCSPGNDGSINVIASGGVGPKSYKIAVDSNTNGQFTNYTTGTYTLSVRDSANTVIDSVFTINPAVPPVYDALGSFIQDITCNGANDGAIFAAVTGGTNPITYNLMPGSMSNTNGTFFPLVPNTYTLTMTDSKNCSDTTTITITQPPAISFIVDSTINISCNGGNNGAIYTTGTGGVGNLFYTITPAIGSQSTPGDFTGLIATNYQVVASDANGCTVSSNVSLTQPSALATTIVSTTNASSSTATDGSIVASASGGTPGYIYSILPSNGTQAPAGTFNNLPPATYTITVTDANGCTSTSMTTVTFEFASNLNDLSQLNINVYPNPVDNVLTIESVDKIKQASILDMAGRTILVSTYGSNTIPMGELPKGIYILKVILENGSEGKMLIQKK